MTNLFSTPSAADVRADLATNLIGAVVGTGVVNPLANVIAAGCTDADVRALMESLHDMVDAGAAEGELVRRVAHFAATAARIAVSPRA